MNIVYFILRGRTMDHFIEVIRGEFSIGLLGVKLIHTSLTTNWESQCIAVCRTRPQSTWSTAVHQSQTFPADVIYGQPLDIAWPYHVTGSALSVVGPSLSLVRRSGTRYSLPDSLHDPALTSNSFRQLLKSISSLPLSTYSSVEMLHDSAL